MANYYHEARAHAKALRQLTDENRRRAERRAEMASVQAETPLNVLRLDGRACKMHKNVDQYMAVQNMESFLAWNGKTDNMIDRFDVRALLDFYRDLDPRARKARKDDEQRELEQLLTFESFRDIIKLKLMGLKEEQGIAYAERENVELRAAAKAAAAAAASAAQGGPAQQPGVPAAGTGVYSTIGFSYGGDEDDNASESSEEESESESDSDVSEHGPSNTEADSAAAELGIDHFSVILRRAERQEEAEAQAKLKKTKRRFSRKKAAERAKRMAGQGLDPFGNERSWMKEPSTKVAADYYRSRDQHRRDSPSYEPEPRKRYRSGSRSSSSQSRSRSPRRRMRTEYITEFSSRHGSSQHRSSGSQRSKGPSKRTGTGDVKPNREQNILEALPSRADPAAAGPVQLPPSAAELQGVKPANFWTREELRTKDNERERNYDKYKRQPSTAGPKKVEKKETPQERLKRLMAAQLNKQIAKDTVTVAQKKLKEEKDRAVQLQTERVNLLRGRSRSASPDRRYQERSRSGSPRHR